MEKNLICEGTKCNQKGWTNNAKNWRLKVSWVQKQDQTINVLKQNEDSEAEYFMLKVPCMAYLLNSMNHTESNMRIQKRLNEKKQLLPIFCFFLVKTVKQGRGKSDIINILMILCSLNALGNIAIVSTIQHF